MEILADKNLTELEELMKEYNQPSFRAKQLQNAIYLAKEGNQISTLSKDLIAKISNNYVIKAVSIIKVLKSQDGTQKFLFKLYDNNIIEGVLMQYKYGSTLCISTQVGCRMGCVFCASGANGLVRQLSSGEILSEVLTVNAYLGGTLKERKITNVVLMGSGEPLDNYDNVIKFLKTISNESCLNISLRNISLSTCGLVDKIGMLAKENLPITLCISLHAPNDELRKQIMPIANRYSIKEIIESVRNYFNITKRRIIFEYCLTKGFNDNDECCKELASILHGLACHINVIPLNQANNNEGKSPTQKEAYMFVDKLTKLNLSATLRRTMGDDIEGACGQLRAKTLKEGIE